MIKRPARKSPKPKPQKTCKGCRFSFEVSVGDDAKDTVNVACRRFPPTLNLVPGGTQSNFPVVPNHWFCGEHKS